MPKKYKRKTKEWIVTVANPKTKEEYAKMIDNLNEFFKNYYSNNKNKTTKMG